MWREEQRKQDNVKVWLLEAFSRLCWILKWRGFFQRNNNRKNKAGTLCLPCLPEDNQQLFQSTGQLFKPGPRSEEKEDHTLREIYCVRPRTPPSWPHLSTTQGNGRTTRESADVKRRDYSIHKQGEQLNQASLQWKNPTRGIKKQHTDTGHRGTHVLTIDKRKTKIAQPNCK